MRYLLKIFSGPHVGAEVVLTGNETTIGSGDDCDVVLEDRLIAEQHVSLSIESDTIRCKQLGKAAVLVDGKPVNECVLHPFQYFTIGTTHLAVGPADKPWPHFDLSDFQLRAPEEPSSNAEPDDNETDPKPEAKPSSQTIEQPAAKRWLSKRVIAAAVIGFNVLLVIIVIAINGSGTANTADADETVLLAVRTQQLREQLDRYAPHVSVRMTNGRFEVTGYVSTDTDEDNVQRLAHQLDPQAIVTVRSTESLLETIQKRLDDANWDRTLTVSSEEPGIVRIKGHLPKDAKTRQRWKSIEEQIEKDVPLRELIVEVDASDNAPEETSFVSMVRSLIPPPDATSSPDLLRTTPLPILDVRVANDKVVTLTDGRQISIGGRFPDGSKVEEIELNHAIVRTARGQRLFVPFGG